MRPGRGEDADENEVAKAELSQALSPESVVQLSIERLLREVGPRFALGSPLGASKDLI